MLEGGVELASIVVGLRVRGFDRVGHRTHVRGVKGVARPRAPGHVGEGIAWIHLGPHHAVAHVKVIWVVDKGVRFSRNDFNVLGVEFRALVGSMLYLSSGAMGGAGASAGTANDSTTMVSKR